MPVVTISRQPGSLALDIAQIISQRMNLELIDQEKIHHMLASECDAQFKDGFRLYEKEIFTNMFERLMLDRPAYRALFKALHYDLAARGGVIIFGRGAQFAFRGFKSVTITRIVANREIRIGRIMAQQNISRNHAMDFDDHFLSKHQSVIQSIFGHDIGNAELYDCTLNTSHFNAEQGADIICQAITHKQSNLDSAVEKAIFKRLAIGKKIETLLHQKVTVPPHRLFSINFSESGMIELKGFVEKKKDIELAVRIAKDYPGVTSVDCQLRSIQSPYISF